MNFKRIALSVVTAGAVLSCANFSAQYERVENDRVRLLDFVYEPAEAAPGDTVQLKAYFAGKGIQSGDITWKVAYKVAMNTYGFDSAFGEQPLEYTAMACSTTGKTTCISMKFIIPEDCLEQSPMIREDWVQTLPEQARVLVPDELSEMSKNELLMQLKLLAHQVVRADSLKRSEITAQITRQFGDYTPLIMQLFTAKIRLYADIRASHRIKSDYTVSYNRMFSLLPGSGVFENHNPVVDSVGIYKVKGANLMRLERDGDSTLYSTLWNADVLDRVATISVERGYTYFLEVFIGGRDLVVTLKDMVDNEPVSTEDLTADWLFQMEEEEMGDLVANDFMNISTLYDLVGVLYVPRKVQIRHFTAWVQVTDSKLNVLNRSQGSALVSFSGEFLYK